MTWSLCPFNVSVSWPVVASHTFTVRSQPAEASRFPSGLNATLQTRVVVPFQCERFLTARGVPHLHRLVPLADASRFPSGLNATLLDQSVCPFKVSIS